MNFDQDFMDWLKADDKAQGTGLLLAPINLDRQTEKNITTTEEQDAEEILIPQQEQELELPEQILIPFPENEDAEIQQPELDTQNTLPPKFDAPDIDTNKAWPEHATGFELSLDEPPHEIWTRINESNSEYDDNDEDEVEYEQGDSLVGAAYEQKHEHGKNFTERLQNTLKGRKKKAEQAREEEENRKPRHPYVLNATKMCVAMLITLGLAFMALLFVQRLNDYVHHLSDNGKELDQSLQTEEELSREIYISADITTEETKSQDIEVQLPSKPPVVPVTFDEFLTEANNAFNLGMYNVAIIYFFRAMELNGSDIRAYIGLAEAYRLRGMSFDSKRIINEAREKFRPNTTIETIAKFLEGENK